MSADRPLLYYIDPHDGGHRLDHLAFNMRACSRAGIRMYAFVPRGLWEGACAQVPELAAEHRLRMEVELPSTKVFEIVRFLKRVNAIAAAEHPSGVHYPRLDDYIRPLFFAGIRAGGRYVPWTGVLFRDGFNYRRLEAWMLKRRFTSTIKFLLFHTVLKRGATELLTFNPRWRRAMPVPVTWLPDAMSSLDAMAEAAARESGVWPRPKSGEGDPNRVKFLTFGSLERRKGILEACHALLRLEDAELARIELRMLGKFTRSAQAYREETLALLDQLRARGAFVETIEGYVSEHVLDDALRRCDVVLAPYLDHIGSSGVLGQAAKYGRPLLSQKTYQMGEEISIYRLGQATDTTDPEAIVGAIRHFLKHGCEPSAEMSAIRADRTSEAAMKVTIAAFERLVWAAANGRRGDMP